MSTVAIIGSGPGGAITAAELQAAGFDVTLVEEGSSTPQHSIKPFSRDEMYSRYRDGGITAALGSNRVNYIEASCVGGGSEVNSGLYHRTPASIIESWSRNFQVQEFDAESLEEHFTFCEAAVNVCLSPTEGNRASRKLAEGAQSLGYDCIEVPRWYRYSPAAENLLSGTRQSMSETFIKRFLLDGGEIQENRRAIKLERAETGWRILLENTLDKRKSVETYDHIVLSCGSIQTPLLLQRSRIGRNAGKSLKMHPSAKVAARFKEKVNGPNEGIGPHQVRGFSGRFSFGCSVSTPAYLKILLQDNPEWKDTGSEDMDNFAAYYVMTSGGRGKVRHVPGLGGIVTYRFEKEELQALGIGMKLLSKTLIAAGATEVHPSVEGHCHLERGQIHKLPNTLAPRARLMTIHLMGSCPMGEDPDRCTADSYGMVVGESNLMINDSSLLGESLGVNPQGTVMAVARRNAHRFIERYL